jgi:hypothetical protein
LSIENSFFKIGIIIAIRQWQSLFVDKTADPIQNVQEAVLGKRDVFQLQLFHRKDEKIC